MALWIVTFSRIVLPDPMITRPTRSGHVGMLGNAADHRPLEEMVFFTQRGPALDDDVVFQNALGADRYVIFDDAKGSNLDAVAKFLPREQPTPKGEYA